MMRAINQKKNVRIISFLVAVIFVLGIGAFAYSQMAVPTYGAENSNIAVVDFSRLQSQQNPAFMKAGQDFQIFLKQTQEDTNAKLAKATTDDEKAKIQMEAQQALQQKQMELIKGLQTQADEAAKAVSKAKGLNTVLSKDVVVFGGVDITDQVLKKMSSDTTNSNQ